MSHDIELPDIFPLDEIRVEEEEHLFEVFQGDSGPLPKTEYTIDKAPIIEIEEISGTLNGRTDYTFEKDVDYELSTDNNDVVWLNGDRPDAGTNFFVTYMTDSIMGRYIDSGSEEFDTVDEKVIDATKSKFVGQAEGDELDEIGKLFGDTIGKRQGRNDTQYRIYLQSVVQSFVSRGTKTGIKLAISAATDVPIADITIDENFETNKYEVTVVPDTPVRVALLETIADIADPSGISQTRTRFPIFEDIGITDTGNATGNQFLVTEDFGLDDLAETPDKDADIIDDVAVNDNAFSQRAEAFDTLGIDDTGLAGGRGSTSDDVSIDDATASTEEEGTYLWEPDGTIETTWGFAEWEEIEEVVQTTTDTAGFDDAFSGATETLVAWDTRNWDDFNWIQEHN